ncbi:cation efflux system protein CzcB [Bryobacterales bacterium F-183]|nr:cation efflux system protein CzcB [Bryobacterales bacterium F-183]
MTYSSFLAFAALVLLAACTGSKPEAAAAPAAAEPAKPVTVDAKTRQQLGIEVAPAEETSLAAPVSATGQLQLNEDRTWKVGAVIEGRIVAMPIKLGERVAGGQVLAQMHSHMVHDARATLQQARAELDRNRVLAEQARRVRDRTQRLLDLKAASREQMEAAETQLRSAEMSVQNAEAELKKSEIHITEFLDVPLKVGPHTGDPATDPDNVPIRAPAPGVVMERLANVGSVVSAAAPVVVISDLSSLWLIAAVNEADLRQIRQGQSVAITVRAYPDRTFPGRVFQLGEHMDPQTRTLQVRVLVSNTGGLLKPDMFANIEFSTQGSRPVIQVPEAAIQDMEGKSVVFIQHPDGTFTPVPVSVGTRSAGRVEITGGLKAGTPVVVKGAVLLKSQLLKGEED